MYVFLYVLLLAVIWFPTWMMLVSTLNPDQYSNSPSAVVTGFDYASALVVVSDPDPDSAVVYDHPSSSIRRNRQCQDEENPHLTYDQVGMIEQKEDQILQLLHE